MSSPPKRTTMFAKLNRLDEGVKTPVRIRMTFRKPEMADKIALGPRNKALQSRNEYIVVQLVA